MENFITVVNMQVQPAEKVFKSESDPKRNGRVVHDLNDRTWGLRVLLNVAKELGVIRGKPAHAQELLTAKARNLIHLSKVNWSN